MPNHERLEAWKACHALVLATWRWTEPALPRDRVLIVRLRALTLRAAGRIVFAGEAQHAPALYERAISQAAALVAEIGYVLSVMDALALLPSEGRAELEALQHQAVHHAGQLVMDYLRWEESHADDLLLDGPWDEEPDEWDR